MSNLEEKLPKPTWLKSLAGLRELQTQLTALAPYRDTCLFPRSAASVNSVIAAEARLGHPLPPSYRQFLLRHDGWSRFFDGADLLSTAELGQKDYSQLAWMAFRAASSPSRVGRPALRMNELLVFGVDAQCTTVFAFETCSGAPNNELNVLSWVGEVGTRSANFEEWLGWLASLCRMDLDHLSLREDVRGVA